MHEGEKGVQGLSLFAVSDLTTVYRVSGEINGGEVTFIIDTGAPITLLYVPTPGKESRKLELGWKSGLAPPWLELMVKQSASVVR